MITTLTRLGAGNTLLLAIGAASIGSVIVLSPIVAASAHASGGTYIDNQSNNEGKGQGGAPSGAPVAKAANSGTESDSGDKIDARSTQGIVRGSIMSHPGDLALPHAEGKTGVGSICVDAKCP